MIAVGLAYLDSTAARYAASLRALGCALLLLAGLPEPSAHATDVVMVLVSDSGPYRAAAEACRERLEPKTGSVQTRLVSDLSTSQLQSPQEDRLYIAIGAQATTFLARTLPPGTALVYCLVSEPELLGVVGRPNTSGVRTAVGLDPQIDLMVRALDGPLTIGVLHRSHSRRSRTTLDRLGHRLPSGWRVEAVDLDGYKSVAAGIDALLSRSVSIVWTFADPAVYDASSVRALLLAALKARTPVFGFSMPLVKAGALLGISIDPVEQGRQAAELALGRIADPGSPERHIGPRHDVVLNTVVARRLGISLPPGLIREATVVFGDR